MKTAFPLQTNVPRSILRGQTSLGPRFAFVITPSAPIGLPRSSVSPPVASTGASTSTRHASAHVREAAPPPWIRFDLPYHLRGSSRREAGEDAARGRADPLGLRSS